MMLPTLRIRLAREWLVAVPGAWRAAAFSLVVGRPLGFLVVFSAAATVLCAAVTLRDSNQVHGIFALMVPVVSLAVTRGIISADRVEGRWILLFQRGQSPLSHYARALVLALGTVWLVVLICALAVAAAALLSRQSADVAPDMAAFGTLWATVLVCATFAVSSLVRRYDLELVLLLLALSFAQGVVTDVLGLPELTREWMRFLLLPVDGVFLVLRALTGEGGGIPTSLIAHLLLYPPACLAVAALRLRALQFSDLPPRQG